jgi:hypothetical protein
VLAGDLTVCVVVERDEEDVEPLLAALREQTAPLTEFDVVVVDFTTGGLAVNRPDGDRLRLAVLKADPASGRAECLNQAWRSASGVAIGFLSVSALPGPGWVDAMRRALARGRRVVSGRWMASERTLPAAGPMSFRLWAVADEAPLVTAAQLGCLRADLAGVGGFDTSIDDSDACDAMLAARLVESGVDRYWARDATVMVDLTAVRLADLVAARRRTVAAADVLADRPRARARLRFGGVVGQRRNAEALLLVAGLGLAGRDRRFLALAAPWLHERTCLTPTGGGHRRRTLVLPGVLAFDLYDAALPVVARLSRRFGPGAGN